MTDFNLEWNLQVTRHRTLPLDLFNIFITDMAGGLTDTLERSVTSQMEYISSFDLPSHISDMSNISIEDITVWNEKPNDWRGVSDNDDVVKPPYHLSWIESGKLWPFGQRYNYRNENKKGITVVLKHHHLRKFRKKQTVRVPLVT